MSEEETVTTHEDIWDDSALVDSWNQALEEYKKYHSIHADKTAEPTTVPDSKKTLRDAKTETNEPLLPPKEGQVDETFHQQAKHAGGTSGPTGGPNYSGTSNDQQRGAPVSPISVLGSVQDDGLKSLLMSWYYAGYYTGLYEEQQKSQQGRS